MIIFKRVALSCLIFLLSFLTSFSQTVTVGDGINFSEEYPFDGYYGYNWSNVIYLSEEINYSGALHSVSFYVDNVPSNYQMFDQKIWVRHTSDTVFDNGNYPDTIGFSKVFEGTITYNGSGWKTITFDSPFIYDGSSNLEFLFENRNGYWASGFPYFRYTELSTLEYRTRRDYYDPSFPDVCQYCQRVNKIPNIQLSFSPCTITPGSLSASDTLIEPGYTSDLTLTGQDSGTTLQWQVSTNNVDFYSISGATSSSYTTNNLYKARYYRVKVQDTSCFKYSDTLKVNVDLGNVIERTIGTGTTISERYPTNGYYNYGWSNMIYLASEINAAGVISQISFYVDNTPSNYVMNNQKIYAKHTSDMVFGNANYPDTNGFQSVFEGTLTFNGSGWYTIVFDQPFFYNGVDNLELLFENRDASWSGGFPYFRNTAVGSGNYRTRYEYRDASFPSNCVICQRATAIPNIQLTIQPCTFDIGTVSASSSLILPGEGAIVSAQDYSNGASIQWEVSSNNTNFSLLSGATSPTYQTGPLNETRYYRVKYTEVNCTQYSDTLEVVVDYGDVDTVAIGNGTSSTERYPFNNYYNYSYANMIYKASEINTSGGLTSVSFHVANSPSNLTMPNQKIYVRHTSATSYSTGNPVYPDDTSGFTLVYDGSITYNGSGWKEIVLDQSFDYNGVDNLEFRFENRAGFYSFDYPKFSFDSSLGEYRVKRDYRDATFPYACQNCARFENYLNIKMVFVPSVTVDAGQVVASPTNVCAGNGTELFALDYADSSSVQWQFSTDGIIFQDIVGAVSANLSVASLDSTRYYRTKITKLDKTVFSPIEEVTVLTNCPTVVEYDTLIGGTIVNVDISNLNNLNGPFDYVITQGELPNKKAMFSSAQTQQFYDFEGDSIALEIDSSFLAGNNPSLSHVFDTITSVGYFNIGVYDNAGDLILSNRRWIGPEITYSSIAGMDIVDGFFIPTDTVSSVTTNMVVDLTEDFEVGITLTTISGSQTLGFSDTTTQFNDFTNMSVGFHTIGNQVYLVEQGELSSQSYPVSEGSSLSIQHTVNGVGYFINDELVELVAFENITLVNHFVLGAAGGIVNPLVFNSLQLDFINWTLPFIKMDTFKGFSCYSTADLSFDFVLRKWFFTPWPDNLYYSVRDLVNNQTILWWTPISDPDEALTFMANQPSVYRITVIDWPTGVPITQSTIVSKRDITLGYPAKWRALEGVTVEGNATIDNEVERTTSHSQFFSNATSVHELEDGETGWYLFDPNVSRTFVGVGDETSVQAAVYFNSTSWLFGTPIQFVTVFPSQDVVPLISTNLRILLKFTTNEIEVYRVNLNSNGEFNPQFVTSETRPSGNLNIRLLSLEGEDKVSRSIFSFGCGELNYSDIFVELKRSQNANYYNTFGGKFHFYFDNDYEHVTTEELSFKLFTMDRTEVVLPDAIPLVYADNRYTLDLSGVNGLSVGEYYTFEIILPKGEKRSIKLKFYN